MIEIKSLISRWHTAVNTRDEAGLRAMVAEHVALGGPKGDQHGRTAAVSWVSRSGILVESVSWHPLSEHEMVVEELATWPGNDDSVVIFVRYREEAGAITAIRRFVHLEDAIAE